MKNFEYAAPFTELDALDLLSPEAGKTAVLAGGTDLVGLMKRMVETPERVVHIGNIESLHRIELDRQNDLWVGAAVHLDEFLDHPLTNVYPAINQVIEGIGSLQLRSQCTIGGELLRRPACWYYRDGRGLLADQGRMVIEGDNRFHAILGNRGPAKFVNPSRLAPAMISLGARVRIVGPQRDEEQIVDLESLFRTPTDEGQREHTIQPDQLLTHVILPADRGRLSATYEIRHGEGPDQPLAAAAVALEVAHGVVQQAKVVLGQVAPIPWIAPHAARALYGKPLTESSAQQAGLEALSSATPLSQNEYKVQLAEVAVRRAILRAAGMRREDPKHGLPSLI